MDEELKLLLKTLKKKTDEKDEREKENALREKELEAISGLKKAQENLYAVLLKIEKGISLLGKKEIQSPEIQNVKMEKPDWYKEPSPEVSIKNLKIPEYPEEIKVKGLKIPEFPKEIDIKRPAWIEKIAALFKTEIRLDALKETIERLAEKVLKVRIEDQAKPVLVVPIDKKGNVLIPSVSVGGTVVNVDKVSLKRIDGQQINPATEDGHLANVPGLSIPVHDYLGLTYTDSKLTRVVYKVGGAGGDTVATLDLAYDDGKMISVTKT